MTPLWLSVIGIALAGPAPNALSHARWLFRAPRSAIIMWQSLALAAILAMFGAGLSTALWLVTSGALTTSKIVLHFVVLALTVVVATRFAWAICHVATETRARRTRHRNLVDLFGIHDESIRDLRVITAQTPMAYCLPAPARSRVVVTQGALEQLTDRELAAVLEHERAHVRNRHDLVLEGFTMLRRAYPQTWATPDAPLEHSRILVELLADDAARKRCGPDPLATALVKLSAQPAPEGTMGAGSASLERLERLERNGRNWLFASVACLAIAATTLVAPTVFLAIPWITEAATHLAP